MYIKMNRYLYNIQSSTINEMNCTSKNMTTAEQTPIKDLLYIIFSDFIMSS